MPNSLSFLQILEMLSYLATILGIPIAILLYMNEKRKERLEREYGTYHALDEKYLEYLNLCIDNPDLDLYYLPLDKRPKLTSEQKIRQYAMFEILVSLMERAFLMYRDQTTRIKKAQWEGWSAYIRDWCGRENFRSLWSILGDQFDENFTNYVNARIQEASGVAD
jgi:hypothetical protein